MAEIAIATPDIVARVTGQALSERLGRQFVIENRSGAGSNIGTEIVVRSTGGAGERAYGRRCGLTLRSRGKPDTPGLRE